MSVERESGGQCQGHLWAHSHQQHGLPPRSPQLPTKRSSSSLSTTSRSSSGDGVRHARLAHRQQSDCPISPVLLRKHLQPELLSPRMARKKAWYEGSCHGSGGSHGTKGLPSYLSLNMPPSEAMVKDEGKSQSSDAVVGHSPAHRRGHNLMLKTAHRSWPSSTSKDQGLKR